VSLHVDRAGAGADLALLHGWGLHGGAWAGIAPALAKRFRIHVIDLPGHGHSAAVGFGDLDQVVDQVAREVPEGAIVCGWSLGGLLGLRMAERHASRVRALALVATTPCFVARADWPHAMAPATLEAFALDLREDLPRTLRSFVALNAVGGADGRGTRRALSAALLARGAPSAAALDNGLALLRATDLRAAAARISQPALVVHGGRDVLAPVAAGRWLAGRLPRAALLELDDAAHLPFASHPAQFLGALARFHG
jgi:pimeloyl-[acyl-carrier protein] methyl ester esterase